MRPEHVHCAGRSRSLSPPRDSSDYDKSRKKLRLGPSTSSSSMHMFTGAKQRDTWGSIAKYAPVLYSALQLP